MREITGNIVAGSDGKVKLMAVMSQWGNREQDKRPKALFQISFWGKKAVSATFQTLGYLHSIATTASCCPAAFSLWPLPSVFFSMHGCSPLGAPRTTSEIRSPVSPPPF